MFMKIKFWQDNDDFFYKAPLKLNPLKVCVINIIALIYISVETQQSSYNILFINKLFHASCFIHIYVYMGHLCGPYSLDMSLRQ